MKMSLNPLLTNEAYTTELFEKDNQVFLFN
jgi:hypothetical protein